MNGNGSDIKYPPTCASTAANSCAAVAVATMRSASNGGSGSTGGILSDPALAEALQCQVKKMHDPKPDKKIFRIITVIAYFFSVSLIAIILSLYYLFLWNPYLKAHKQQQQILVQQQTEAEGPITTTLEPEYSYEEEDALSMENIATETPPLPVALSWVLKRSLDQAALSSEEDEFSNYPIRN